MSGSSASVQRRWGLLARLSDEIWLTGWMEVRLRDVEAVEPAGNAAFVTEALRLRGEWPLTDVPLHLDLTSRRRLLRSLCGTDHLIAVHPERRDPDICFVGVVRALDRQFVAGPPPEDAG